jgi:hypothetical protein
MSSSPPTPNRPPMEPASGVHRVKLGPHQMTVAVTATENLFVLAHLGIPRIDPAQWSLTIAQFDSHGADRRAVIHQTRTFAAAAHQLRQ